MSAIDRREKADAMLEKREDCFMRGPYARPAYKATITLGAGRPTDYFVWGVILRSHKHGMESCMLKR